jgi:hypothetical protein
MGRARNSTPATILDRASDLMPVDQSQDSCAARYRLSSLWAATGRAQDYRVILSSDARRKSTMDSSQPRKEFRPAMLQFISTLLSKFRREDEEGQTLVEYGLLLASSRSS